MRWRLAIEETQHGLETYQFSHALVHQAIYEELSPSRRVRLHSRIGEALEAIYGANADAHASELAEHNGQSNELEDSLKAIR